MCHQRSQPRQRWWIWGMPLRVAHQLAHRLMRYGPLAADPPIKLGATSAAVECESG
jgi:hypothetical protein